MNKNIKYFQKEEQNKKLSSHSCEQSQFTWNVSKHWYMIYDLLSKKIINYNYIIYYFILIIINSLNLILSSFSRIMLHVIYPKNKII